MFDRLYKSTLAKDRQTSSNEASLETIGIASSMKIFQALAISNLRVFQKKTSVTS
jgi:hypothetical protein